eukprot:TRINITY_DN457_c0_g1_i3.p1 TRINITY_DN457_c0_g1~~TRINITY_DN457_c0_g1_i3.p1  ORF type:complete len:1028 (-),score=468.85 TRINITY_DN457_c0_g1_i3:19-3102(-)
MKDDGCVKICENLAGNTTLTSLNLETNNIGTDGTVALANLVNVNRAITELKFTNQSKQSGNEAERWFAACLEGNPHLLKCTIGLRDMGSRNSIDRSLSRNQEIARRAKQQGLSVSEFLEKFPDSRPPPNTKEPPKLKFKVENAKCRGCSKTVYAAEQVQALGMWHRNCFRCKACDKQLAPAQYNDLKGEPYCSKCYEDLSAGREPVLAVLKQQAEEKRRSEMEKVQVESVKQVEEEAEQDFRHLKSLTAGRTAPKRRPPTKRNATQSSLRIQNPEIFSTPTSTSTSTSDDIWGKIDSKLKADREKEEKEKAEEKQKRSLQARQAQSQMVLPTVKSGQLYEGQTSSISSFERIFAKIKGRRSVQVRRVERTAKEMNKGDVFMLDCKDVIYIWNGPQANRLEKAKGIDVAHRIKNKERGGSAKVIVLTEGDDDDDEFWDRLGGKIPIADAEEGGDDIQYENDSDAAFRLLKFFEEDGKIREIPVENENPKKRKALYYEMLETPFAYVIDAETEVYVWTGKKSAQKVRNAAMEVAKKIVQESPYASWLTPKRMIEGGETIMFKEKFVNWPDSLLINVSNNEGTSASNIDSTKQEPYDVKEMLSMEQWDRLNVDIAKKNVDEGGGEIKIWRIKGFEKIEVSPEFHGIFHENSSYIVHYSYNYRTGPTGAYVKYVLYFWQGSTCNKNEKGLSALMTKDIFDSLGSQGLEATQERQPQNKETLHFLNLFRGRLIFRKNSAEDSIPDTALFQLRQCRQPVIHAVQVEKNPAVLNTTFPFVLQTLKKHFLWFGNGISSKHKENILKFSRNFAGNLEHVQVEEGSEGPEFWEAMGTKGNFTEFSSLKRETFKAIEGSWRPRLYLCGFEANEICKTLELSQDDLDDSHVMILEAFEEIFVWLPERPKELEKKLAFDAAIEMAKTLSGKDGRPSSIEVLVVNDGKEPLKFSRWFVPWKFQGNPDENSAVPVEEYLSILSRKYTLQELVENCPKGLDKTKLEEYLYPEEFQKVFNMTREEWDQLPKWRQQEIKKTTAVY